MPSTTSRQAKFMAAAAHDKEFAQKAGIPQEVAKEFNDADQSVKHFKKTKIQKMYKDTK